jgi:hypothetical protein
MADQLKVCPRCGTPNEPEFIFCKNCGERLESAGLRCPNCNNIIRDASAKFCPACGAPLTQGQPKEAVVSNAQAVPAQPVQTATQMHHSPNEMRAIAHMKYFSIISVIGIVVGLIYSFSGISIVSMVGAARRVSINAGISSIVILLDLVLFFLGLYFLISSFGELSREDKRFATPYTLSMVMAGGLLVLLVALVLTLTLAFVFPLLAFLSLFLLIISIIMLLLGLIGILIGIWRLGTRYNEVLFKVAAIFYIIPVLDVVAPFLLLSASASVERRLRNVS